jgi:hypothetical protein
MSYVVTSEYELNRVVAPRLPVATSEYDENYVNQLNNVLRLYFNQLDNIIGQLSTSGGISGVRFPFIAASDNAIQYATAADTPTIIQWDTLEQGNGFTLNAGNTATAEFAGIYKITYSLQFANNDNAAHDAVVWLRVNGATSAADITDSSTVFTVAARKSAGVPTFVCGYSEVVFQLDAGDTLGLWWGTNQAATSGGATGIYIDYRAAQTTPMPYPAVPSAIGSITFVSALPT